MTQASPVAAANGEAPAYLCFNPVCMRHGTHYPVILFGPVGRVPGEALPYRLEVPKAVCLGCQRQFQADTFISPEARIKIEDHLRRNDRPAPDYGRLFVTWKSLVGADWQEVKAGGEARFWF